MASLFLRFLTVGGMVTAVLLPLLLGYKWLEGRYSAQTRWILWLSMAGVLLIAPLLPQRAAPVQVEVPSYALPMERTTQAPKVSVPAGPDAEWVEQPGSVDGEKVPAHTDVGTVTETPQAGPVSRRVDWTELAAAVWLGVAALLLAGEGLRYLLVRWRLMKLSRPMAGEREGSPLRVLAGLGSPVTVGFCRPAVFLPSEETDPMAVGHELTHIQRRDIWGKALLFLACALYWFHPLVWLMARRADRDVEAACDAQMAEGLSLTERRAYGELLLASAGEAGALPFATRFGGSKEQMKARLTQLFRPGKRSRMLVCVLLAAALLLSGLVACREAETAPDAPGALTAEELEWFQEEFFHSGSDNIRNVFGRPGRENVYEKPQDIDLYRLFYDGPCLRERVTATEEELRAAYPDLTEEEITTPAYRVTRAEMDEVLLKYTGLTLEETGKVGLDGLPYLKEQDAWYWMHGGTGYPGPLTLLSGVREGNTVRLYQRESGVIYCLTLEQQSEGEYWFVSNLPVAEEGAVPEGPETPTPSPSTGAGLHFAYRLVEALIRTEHTEMERLRNLALDPELNLSQPRWFSREKLAAVGYPLEEGREGLTCYEVKNAPTGREELMEALYDQFEDELAETLADDCLGGSRPLCFFADGKMRHRGEYGTVWFEYDWDSLQVVNVNDDQIEYTMDGYSNVNNSGETPERKRWTFTLSRGEDGLWRYADTGREIFNEDAASAPTYVEWSAEYGRAHPDLSNRYIVIWEDGTIWAWGINTYGQLDSGQPGDEDGMIWSWGSHGPEDAGLPVETE